MNGNSYNDPYYDSSDTNPRIGGFTEQRLIEWLVDNWDVFAPRSDTALTCAFQFFQDNEVLGFPPQSSMQVVQTGDPVDVDGNVQTFPVTWYKNGVAIPTPSPQNPVKLKQGDTFKVQGDAIPGGIDSVIVAVRVI